MPGMLCSSDTLAELQGFLRPNNLCFHCTHTRHNFPQVFLNASFRLRVFSTELAQNAGQVGTVAREQIARIRRLKVADSVGAKAVKTHARESLVKRTKLWITRDI